jgi:hypothetical protein
MSWLEAIARVTEEMANIPHASILVIILLAIVIGFVFWYVYSSINGDD